MAAIKVIALALLLPAVAVAEQTLRSRSGQFVIAGLPAAPRFASYVTTGRVDYVRLDPAVLAVSCERIKETLLGALDLSDEWKGVVNVRVFAVRRDNEPVRFTAIRYRDGWGYGLELPEWITRERLMVAVLQAVLSEIANRKSERAAELPAWLLEGATAYLLANNPDGMILEMATRTMKRHGDDESLAQVRETLRTRSALSFDELSWPKAEPDPIYTHCAHLFVHELLNLRAGPRCLAEMVRRLPEHYNWQTTFLAAFKPHFTRLVDVDKWWALAVAHVTGRDPMSIWPLEQTLAQLRQLLVTPVQVRMKDSTLPGTTEVRLQTIIGEWDDKRQEPVLALKVNQLQALRLRAPPEALELIDGYMTVLQDRLRGRAGESGTVRRLNEMDAQLSKFSSPPPKPAGR